MKKNSGKMLAAACCLIALGLQSMTASFSAEEVVAVNAEDADLLIEDDEDVVVISQGESLEQVLSQEEAEAQAQAQAVPILEDTDVTLQDASEASIRDTLAMLLAQDNPTGSDGELEVCDMISRTMEQMGYTVSTQAFHEGFINDSFTDVPGVNIIAERGADSDARNEGIIVLCAHYDSKTDPEEEDLLANDKSGTAVLMETARILKDVRTDTDVCFLFLSGEEDGGYGAARLAESLDAEILSRIRGVIYVGTVGMNTASADLIGTGSGMENRLSQVLAATGREYDSTWQENTQPESNQQESNQQESNQPESTQQESTQPGTDDQTGDGSGLIEEERLPVLENWTVVQHQGFGCDAFTQAGLETAFFFQDVNGAFSYTEEQPTGTDYQRMCRYSDILARTALRYMVSSAG